MEDKQTSFSHSVNVQFGSRKSSIGFGFWVGVALVFVGGGLLLDAFGFAGFDEFIGTWWPSILMFIAVAQLATGSGSIVGSGILFSVGALLQLSEFGILPGGFWSAFWPIVLILIGLSIIGKRLKKKTIHSESGSIGRISVDGSRVNKSAVFGGAGVRVASTDFTGGELTAVCGGIECDMRDAQIQGKVAMLSVTAICGGVEIRVPEHWNTVVAGTPIFGGIDDKTVRKPFDPNAPTLHIDATIVFGGIELRS